MKESFNVESYFFGYWFKKWTYLKNKEKLLKKDININ